MGRWKKRCARACEAPPAPEQMDPTRDSNAMTLNGASLLPGVLKATILSFLTLHERILVFCLPDDEWKEAAKSKLAWRVANFHCLRMKKFDRINAVACSRIVQFCQEHHCSPTSICDLCVTGCVNMVPTPIDISPLSSFNDLHTLALREVQLGQHGDLQGVLSSLPHLTTLSVQAARHLNLSPFHIPHMPALSTLKLYGFDRVTGMQSLPALTDLTLSIRGDYYGINPSPADVAMPPSVRRLSLRAHIQAACIATLTALTFLHSDDWSLLTRLRDHLAASSSSLSFACLETLHLECDRDLFKGLPILARDLPNLREFVINCSSYQMYLNMAGMQYLCSMRSLQRLTITQAYVIDDQAWPLLNLLTNLQKLSLSKVRFKGEAILAVVSRMPHLTDLEMTGWYDRDCCSNVGTIQQITHIRSLCIGLQTGPLYSNMFHPELPDGVAAAISHLASLTALTLQGGCAQDADLLAISTLHQLRTLRLVSNRALFTRSGLSHLSALSFLDSLTLPVARPLLLFTPQINTLRRLIFILPNQGFPKNWSVEKACGPLRDGMPRLEELRSMKLKQEE